MLIRSATRGRIFAAVLFSGILAAATPALGQSEETSDPPETAAPVQPSPSDPKGQEIFAALLKQNESRAVLLQEYSAIRTYSVIDLHGKVHASETVQMEYNAPDKKTFVTTSSEGSYLVRHLVLNRLIESEISAASGKDRRDSSITPANYDFTFLGQEPVGGHWCYVVEAHPRRRDKYLFEGKVWIDRQDFAVVKIEGQPAKKLSFWIKQAKFVREYEKIGDLWLPAEDKTYVDVRFYGKKILTIEHHTETVNGVKCDVLMGHGSSAMRVSDQPKSN
jgi:hypothetical protein